MGSSRNSDTTKLPKVLPAHCGSSRLLRHAVDLPDEDVTVVGGIRVCTRERLMFDFARFRPPIEALPTVDRALAQLAKPDKWRPQVNQAQCEAVRHAILDRLASLRSTRGVHRAVEVIRFAERFSESAGESVMRWGLLAHGLPRPVAQHQIALNEETVYFLDAFLPALGIAFEHDGVGKYNNPDIHRQLMAEKRRDLNIRRHGVDVHHTMHSDLASFEAFGAALHRSVGSELLARFRPRTLLRSTWSWWL